MRQEAQEVNKTEQESQPVSVEKSAQATPAMPEPHVEVINGAVYYENRTALATKKFALREGNRWFTADLSTPSGKLKAIAELKPDPEKIEPYLTSEQVAQWQKRMGEYVMAMDDLTADVMDIIVAKWLRQAEQWQDMVAIKADDFLQMRGLQKHKSGVWRGGFTEEQRKEISRHLSILSNTWITVIQMEVIDLIFGKKGHYRKRTNWEGRSRAILVDTVIGHVDDLEGFKPYSWDIRPGGVFARFLFGPGRQTALLALKALEYDPYYEKWEKRLTRYFSYQWRIRQGSKSYFQPFTVETLLKAIGEEVDTKNPIKTKKRLEKALNRITKDGVMGSWRYVVGMDESIVGKKGWWKKWLTWKVVIEPAKEVIEQYAKIKNPEE